MHITAFPHLLMVFYHGLKIQARFQTVIEFFYTCILSCGVIGKRKKELNVAHY